ncbi:c-type cytochrome [Algibacter miyuki]|uniref:C-type cytochrome n=1 Tax=Algibacter miyuki TaxID=1306933 RepID=A0ABV5H4Y1_9FLAO|nr:cytochrome c [Algibacter miyuki]MDN3665871.1 cytochrome c [Algibacter miyuki]
MKFIAFFVIICFSLYSTMPVKTLYTQTDPLKESIARGSEIYTDFCMSCHLPDGKGVENVYPPLAQSDFLIKERVESIKIIKFGKTGSMVVNGKTYNGSMAPLGLSDDEVADVMNYISNTWGNINETIITEDDVAKLEK